MRISNIFLASILVLEKIYNIFMYKEYTNMDEKEILKFRESVKDLSAEELEEKAEELSNAISKMILDSDLIIKAAIVDTLIKEKRNEWDVYR